MVSRNHAKRILLIDAVHWASTYPTDAPLRDVFGWYARWFRELPQIELFRRSAEEDLTGIPTSGFDGIIISGSPRDAWADDPVNHRLCDLVLACQKSSIPVLGVCYGHQILGRALGGKVARQPQGLELGNTQVQLTPAGRRSPLFADLPDRFDVLSSHADAVLELPPGGELLVQGDFTPIQGFRVGERLLGVQFHPETDPDVLRFLWTPRLEAWRSRVSFDLEATLRGLVSTPLAPQILKNFATQIVP